MKWSEIKRNNDKVDMLEGVYGVIVGCLGCFLLYKWIVGVLGRSLYLRIIKDRENKIEKE